MKKALVYSLSLLYNRDGYSPKIVLKILLCALKCNDNVGNPYLDNYYVAALVRAVGNVRIRPSDEVEVGLLDALTDQVTFDNFSSHL